MPRANTPLRGRVRRTCSEPDENLAFHRRVSDPAALRAGRAPCFGICDYVLGLYHLLPHSKLRIINTCDEQGAGFAADAYARVRGLGAVCVTYCVGGLKVANTTAEAFAEKSPVVVISGAPGMREREKNPAPASQGARVRHAEKGI